MISIAQLAWKFYLLLVLFPTLSCIIAGFVCISFPFLVLLLTSSIPIPIRLLISFGVSGVDGIYRGRLGRCRYRQCCLGRRSSL